MELIIIILLLVALVISLLLNLNYFNVIKVQLNKSDGDKKDIVVGKFQVIPGKDKLLVIVRGYDNTDKVVADNLDTRRLPKIRELNRFILKTDALKSHGNKLVAEPIGQVIPKEYLGDNPLQKDIPSEGPIAVPASEHLPTGWPPTVTEIDIQTNGND